MQTHAHTAVSSAVAVRRNVLGFAASHNADYVLVGTCSRIEWGSSAMFAPIAHEDATAMLTF